MRETAVALELLRLLFRALRSASLSLSREEESGPAAVAYVSDTACICFSLGVNSKLSVGKVTLLDSYWLPAYLPLEWIGRVGCTIGIV